MKVLILLLEGFEAACDTITLIVMLLLLKFVWSSVIAGLKIPTEVERSDGSSDHFVFYVVLPEWGTLANLDERLHRLLTSHNVVKLDCSKIRLSHKTRVVVTLLEVFGLQCLSLLGILLYLFIEAHLESVRPLNLVIAPLIGHNALICRKGIFKGLFSTTSAHQLLHLTRALKRF